MKKIYTLFFFIITISPFLFAQDDDYVISNPKLDKKEFTKPTISDSSGIPNPDYTAYFLSATAYTLKKKQIRVSGTDILFIKGSYGLTDNTTASVNISLLGTATASIKQQFTLSESVKFGVSGSGGLLLYTPADPNQVGTEDTSVFWGGGQAMITLGDKQDNITAGTGIYYLKSTFDFVGNGKNSFLINNIYIGIQKQISKKLYFMIEGMYFINYQLFTGAIGVKFIVGERISLNAGLMPLGFENPSTNQTEIPIALPLISFRMLLGRK